jgi:hypothetical protein
MKRATTSHERCVYCGTDQNLTVDHVPPKLLLMQPYPTNLITVPACQPCNQSFQKDDEYTRTMLSIDVRASKNAAAQSNLPKVLRSLQKPNARGFAEYLMRQAENSVILGQDGSPMGHVFELDKARVNRAGERFIRALYFKETGAPVSSGSTIRVGCDMDLRPKDPETVTIALALRTLPDWRNASVGTAFSYLAAFGNAGSAWLMLLYDFFFWLGTVQPSKAAP